MLKLDRAAIAAHVNDQDLPVVLLQGESLEILKCLDDNSIDSLVTDPPAGIGFMGQLWDTFDRGYIDAKEAEFRRAAERTGRRASRNGRACYSTGYDYSSKGGAGFRAQMRAIFEEVLRVLKPGAHGLVWALPKTSHWTAMALEEAGFEVRDVLVHVVGSGFPKNHGIAKAIEKKFGPGHGWAGWGTALKPAAEHWILVRKPLSEKTIAANVLRWGTGGLHIDACRIGSEAIEINGRGNDHLFHGGFDPKGEWAGKIMQGRHPANLIFSHHPECECIGQRSVKASQAHAKMKGWKADRKDGALQRPEQRQKQELIDVYQCVPGCPVDLLAQQHALAPRFFYCAKPSAKEREAGLEKFEERKWVQWAAGGNGGVDKQPTVWSKDRDTRKRNIHPTVKPVGLMRYLCRLITPPGGIVLDCFLGSGTTGVAAVEEDFRFRGIDREAEYVEIAAKRIQGASEDEG